MGLEELPFFVAGPPQSAAFSKLVRKGKELELSGAEPFHSIVLPLSRSLDHASELYKPPGNQSWIAPTLTLGVCVLDAPMILIEDPDKVDDPLLAPWIRVVRQESRIETKSRGDAFKYYVFDFVHTDYCATFLRDHLMPFFDGFSERVMEKSTVLVSGGGEVKDLTNWDWRAVT